MNPVSRGLWILALIALGLPLLCSTAEAAALPLVFEGAWSIELDQHLYPVQAGALSVDTGVFTVGAATALTNCRREGGQPQTLGVNSLSYGGGLRVVYLDLLAQSYQLRFDSSGPVLALASATGDIVCDGEVLAEGTIFRTGYE